MTHFRTCAVHAGQPPDASSGALATPIVPSTAFGYGSLERRAALFAGEISGYRYSRFANPTVAALEAKLADLEGASTAVAFASGTAATASVCWRWRAPVTKSPSGATLRGTETCFATWASAGASAW